MNALGRVALLYLKNVHSLNMMVTVHFIEAPLLVAEQASVAVGAEEPFMELFT